MSFITQTNSGHERGVKRHFEHYMHLFIRRLWYIIPSFTIVTLAFIWAIIFFDLLAPQLQSSAVLHFDDPDQLSAVQERVNLRSDTKAVLVKSRTFLEGVARKLSLQLQVHRYPRSDIFSYIKVDPDAPLGRYNLKIDNNRYTLFYTDKSKITTTVTSGDMMSLSEIKIPGVTLRFSAGFLIHPYEVAFSVRRLRDAVDYIVQNMVVKTAGKDGVVMTISLSGKDYEMITSIINTIANDFVNQNILTKNSRKNEIIKILDKQLKTAREEMVQSQLTLRKYREANPTLGLTDAFSPPVTLLDLKESEAELRSSILQAEMLQNRYRSTIDTSRLAVIGEMISFLSKYQSPTAAALFSEHQILSEESRRLKNEYSPLHSLAVKNREDISALGTKVNSALIELTGEFRRKVAQNDERIQKLNSQLAALPSKELHLSNLQRRYDVASAIYAGVLTRYNEALIAQAVAIGDVYVVDHAVIPERILNFKTILGFTVVGLFLAMSLSFGPVLLQDHFDRTARTERDLRHLTDLHILESIPVKGSWLKRGSTPKEVTKKLVASDFSQCFTDETYRSLRAKILLGLKEERQKRILVTSLGIGEGKSLTAANLAITMAQQNIPTLLIDGDMRRGIQHVHFNVQKLPGLSSILSGTSPLGSSLINQAIQKTHIPSLSVLGSGESISNSAELLNSLRFRDLLNVLSDEYEMIIFDTPPVAVTTDAVGIQDAFHRYIFVVKAAHTNISELNRKIQEFPGLRSKVMGIVFNGAPYKRTEYYQYTNYKYTPG